MKNIFILVFSIFIFGSFLGQTGQVGINTATPTVHLDARSATGNSAIAFGNTTQTASAAGAGAMKYNNSMYYSDGVNWLQLVGNSLNDFIPKVVASGRKTTPESFTTDTSDTHAWNFDNVNVLDGSWDAATSAYTVPYTGYYQISIGAAVGANIASNNVNWCIFVYTGTTEKRNLVFSLSNITVATTFRGNTITLHLEAGQTVKLGSVHCLVSCTSGPVTYTVPAGALFTITQLGG